MWTLPRTEDIVKNGFTGRSVSRYRESYLPRGYATHAFDVLSRVSKDLRFGARLNEIRDAVSMAKSFERDSLTLYDRLYFCKKLALAHEANGSKFLMRAKKNSLKEIPAFLRDRKRKKKKVNFHGTELYLVKIWNPREKEWVVFITNLSGSWVKPKLIQGLYRLRWEVETSFKELTATTRIEQWHSKSLNGILQEIFALFWLINFVKIQSFFRGKKPENPLLEEYRRPNFKLLFNYVLLNFQKILKRKPGVLDQMAILIRKSIEKRKRNSRSYKREIKGPASPYPYNNTLWASLA